MSEKSKTERRVFHNPPPDSAELAAAAPVEIIKREFGKRVQKKLVDFGWNQSELARQASLHMPNGRFGRDMVSAYVRGRNIPGPIHLAALSKALKCEPTELLPARATPSVENASPSFDIKETSEGRVWLRVNKEVDWAVAMEIMKILRE
jgi:transcriptional regulator with XRE-family HTH domain